MRRSVIGLIVTLTLAFFLTLFSSEAQQAETVPRIGILETGSPSSPTPSQEAFRQGLRDLSYVEGKNIMLEYRYAEGRFERLPDLAAELTHLKVDVLVTSGSQPVQALKQATSTIPIVGVVLADPIGTGFAASFARPGGNITGLAFQNADLSTKRLELLKEAVPGGTRVAVLWDSHNPASASAVRTTEEAAQSLGLQLHLLEVQGPQNFDSAFAAAQKGHAQALLQVGSPLFSTHRKALLDLVAQSRLPATCETRAFVVEGCLMAYGPSFADMWRRAATYVDKILQGTKPADLPIEQPMKFELVINLGQPGGNITGLSSMSAHLRGKQLELLKETVPLVSRIAVLANPDDPGSPAWLHDVQAAAHALRVQLHVLEVQSRESLERAFAAIQHGGIGAFLILTDPLRLDHFRSDIIAFALQQRLPTVYTWRTYPEAGGLMSYGPSISDLHYRAASYVDRILKGAKPSDLPVEQPMKFELLINLKTAKALGLTLPPTLLYQADEVIR